MAGWAQISATERSTLERTAVAVGGSSDAILARVLSKAAEDRADQLGRLLLPARMRSDHGTRANHRVFVRDAFACVELGVGRQVFPDILFAGVEAVAENKLQHGLGGTAGASSEPL